MQKQSVKSKDLAELLKMDKSSFSQFLTGKRNIGLKRLETLFEYLKIKLIVK